jgi:hypothetical protein
LEGLVSPNAFLIFSTLGSEIPKARAIFVPVFPALTIALTLLRAASVILARILTAFSSVFLDEFAPRFSIATLTAVTRPLSESKPKVAGKEAHSAASSFSRRTTSVLAFRNLSTFQLSYFETAWLHNTVLPCKAALAGISKGSIEILAFG